MSNRNALRTCGVVSATALAGILLAAPAQARIDPGTSLNDRVAPRTATRFPPVTPTVITVDDNALEYLQLGAGLLAGMSLAGAAAAVASRRQHRDPQPA